ncbi:hypothetical protein AA313_de0209919 [Arthrobotrys entomopaga]|nr:hypothetical protein AA313_de0209919 [Arthrobotrys entomopaga]
MADSIFFSGRIEVAIAAAVENKKLLACFVTDESDESNTWENDYLTNESVSSSLKDSAVAVRLLKDSTEVNYLNAFCTIATFPTLLIIRNGGAGVDGLTIITNPISKEDFIAKIESTFSNQQPANLLDGVNSGPSFPATAPEPTTAPATITTTAASQPQTTSTEDEIPENSQFQRDSATARRLASIQQQHRERIARLKAQREAAEREEEKKKELARRSDTKAMAEAAETQKSRSNKQYAEEQKKRKMEMERERKRVLEQIKADREEMKIREMNRKAIAAEAAADSGSGASSAWEGASSEKGKEREGGVVPADGQCNIAFRLLDGSRISNKFPADGTVEKHLRPWLDKNRHDGKHPYKLVVQSSSMSSKNIEGSSTLSELGLYPSAILILKPISNARVSTAFAPVTRSSTGPQHNFLIAFLLSIWLMIKTFLGLENPAASVIVGEKEAPKSGDSSTTSAESSSGSSASAAKDAARKRIRTLHDGDGGKRSAYYNGNQLDFEPKKGDEGKE